MEKKTLSTTWDLIRKKKLEEHWIQHEKKLSENDYFEAKKFAHKAHVLYPKLDALEQVRLMIDVYISASNKINGEEADWYGVLGVDPLADDETLKKQYKKLALLLHPDKNRLIGAEDAFKLVLEAWCLLSDSSKRFAYDQKRKPKQVNQKEKRSGMSMTEPPKPQQKPSYCWFWFNDSDFESKPKYVRSLKNVKVTFWTACNRCKTYCEFMKDTYLNKNLTCPNCGEDFVATEITPELINGRLVIRLSSSNHSRSKSFTSNTSSTSASNNSAKAKATPERMLRWFEPKHPLSKNKKVSTFWTVCYRCKTYCKFVRAGSLNKTLPCPNCSENFVAAEIIPEIINGGPVIVLSPSVQPKSKRGPVVSLNPSVQSKGKSTSDASSTTSASDSAKAADQREEMMKRWFPESREKRLFETPMTTGNANSTFEAERLFKNHMADVK